MKYLFLSILVVVLLLSGYVSADWSIADPSIPGNQAYIKSVEEQGYWNFEWDPTNPISAAIYCCQWEMVHGANMKYWNALNSASSSNSSSSSSGSSSVETKSYCPACGGDDDFKNALTDSELQALSDEMMAKKPWLKEGKPKGSSVNSNIKNNTSSAIFSFTEPVKV